MIEIHPQNSHQRTYHETGQSRFRDWRLENIEFCGFDNVSHTKLRIRESKIAENYEIKVQH
jgi:hypothetical protein